MKNKYGAIALGLIVLQLLIVFSSWLITAAFPEVNINSLLSGRGLRWFAGQFTNNLKSNMLVWLILLSIDWGDFTTYCVNCCADTVAFQNSAIENG